jgi:acyl-CoA synthetase (AMP-forming)/AMP-acid ligase II
MASPEMLHELTTWLDSSAATDSGIIIYPDVDVATRIAYRELRDLALQKATILRSSNGFTQRKVVLIHFDTHLQNIVWFWATLFANCIPAMSTPLVNNEDGRLSHFEHLYHLLLDPIVLTTEVLMAKDFTKNVILNIVTVEGLEITKRKRKASKFDNNEPVQHRENGGWGSKRSKTHPTKVHKGSPTLEDVPADSQLHIVETRGSEVIDGDRIKPFDETLDLVNGVDVLMLTSGSTGNAKAVSLTYKQLFAAISGKLSALPIPSKSSVLNWIGLDHVASLVEIHLCAMFAGIDQIHISAKRIVADPLLFLRLLSQHHVSRTFAPQFFLQKLQATLDTATLQELDGIQLDHLLYLNTGGEPNSVDTCVHLTKHLMRLGVTTSNIIVPGFGMTETCAGAIFNTQCPYVDVRPGNEFTSLGSCMPGIEMRVSRTTATEQKVSTGSLELRGPVVFRRYFNNQVATSHAFTPDGWFKTGDLATIDVNGRLDLVGRSKDLVIINGVKYLPHEIERAIHMEKLSGISQSIVACFAHRPSNTIAEEIYVIYQHAYDDEDKDARYATFQSISRIVMLFTGSRPRVLPLPHGRLDTSTLGKMSRQKIRSSLTRGDYKDQEEINSRIIQSCRGNTIAKPQNDTERKLMTVFLDTVQFGDLDIGVDTPILEVGVSSVDLIRLKSACEKVFSIADIPIIMIMTNTTIRTLATAIKDIQSHQYAEQYNPVVTLQPNGCKTPLWLIHPGIGEILVFLGLIQYFPDRPMHTLRARGFNPGEVPFDSLSRILTTYHEAIKKQQPKGPYALAGYSYGSMLAFEVTKVLEANGDEVRFLASL